MDYSPYFYTYDNKNPDSGAPEARVVTDCTHSKSKKPKLDIVGLIAVLMIILPIIAVLIFVDTATGNGIKTAVVSAFSSGKRTAYMVARGGYEDEKEASRHAVVTRQAGGAGYIYFQNNRYYVALATYFDKKEAKAVSDKNDGSIVIELKFDGGKAYNDKDDDLYALTADTCFDEAKRLSDCASGLEAHSLSTSEALAVCADVRDRAYALKSRILDSSKLGEKEKLLSAVEPLFGGTEAISTLADESTLSPALRYVVSSVVVAVCALGE